MGAANPNYGNHDYKWTAERTEKFKGEGHASKRPEVRVKLSAGLRKSWESHPDAESRKAKLRRMGAAIFSDDAIRNKHRAAIIAYHQRRKAAGIPMYQTIRKMQDK